MGRKNKAERYMEVDVPQELMSEVAQVIENSEMDASILGTGDEAESISIGISYVPEQRGSLMEILELIEDYEPEDSEEEEDEQEED